MSNITVKKASLKQLEHEVNKRKQAKISELEIERTKINEKIRSLAGEAGVVETLTTSKKSGGKMTNTETVVVSGKIKKSMKKTRTVSDKPLQERLTNIAADGQVRTVNEYLSLLENDGWKSTSSKPYYVVAAGLVSLENKNMMRRVKKGSYELVKST